MAENPLRSGRGAKQASFSSRQVLEGYRAAVFENNKLGELFFEHAEEHGLDTNGCEFRQVEYSASERN